MNVDASQDYHQQLMLHLIENLAIKCLEIGHAFEIDTESDCFHILDVLILDTGQARIYQLKSH